MSKLDTRGVLAIAGKQITHTKLVALSWQQSLGNGQVFSFFFHAFYDRSLKNTPQISIRWGQEKFYFEFFPTRLETCPPNSRPSPRARELLESYFTDKNVVLFEFHCRMAASESRIENINCANCRG
jgi:hypothetical protein